MNSVNNVFPSAKIAIFFKLFLNGSHVLKMWKTLQSLNNGEFFQRYLISPGTYPPLSSIFFQISSVFGVSKIEQCCVLWSF